MAKKNIKMAWSKCTIEIGQAPEDGTMATTLTDIGTIKDKSSTLEPSDGDTLEAKATGGITVAKETQEGGLTLKTRVIEPEDSLLILLGIAATSGEELQVTTHLVSGEWSVKVTPKNVGAKGIKIPCSTIAYKPGWSEEEGNYADIEFEVVKGAGDYWYSKFTKAAAATASN